MTRAAASYVNTGSSILHHADERYHFGVVDVMAEQLVEQSYQHTDVLLLYRHFDARSSLFHLTHLLTPYTIFPSTERNIDEYILLVVYKMSTFIIWFHHKPVVRSVSILVHERPRTFGNKFQ